jgi:hypothetical protein
MSFIGIGKTSHGGGYRMGPNVAGTEAKLRNGIAPSVRPYFASPLTQR